MDERSPRVSQPAVLSTHTASSHLPTAPRDPNAQYPSTLLRIAHRTPIPRPRTSFRAPPMLIHVPLFLSPPRSFPRWQVPRCSRCVALLPVSALCLMRPHAPMLLSTALHAHRLPLGTPLSSLHIGFLRVCVSVATLVSIHCHSGLKRVCPDPTLLSTLHIECVLARYTSCVPCDARPGCSTPCACPPPYTPPMRAAWCTSTPRASYQCMAPAFGSPSSSTPPCPRCLNPLLTHVYMYTHSLAHSPLFRSLVSRLSSAAPHSGNPAPRTNTVIMRVASLTAAKEPNNRAMSGQTISVKVPKGIHAGQQFVSVLPHPVLPLPI